MKKTKYLLGLILFIVIIAMATTVNAAVNVTRNIYSNNGSMKFEFTGLELYTTHEYEFGLTKTTAAAVENWYSITEYTATSATTDVKSTVSTMRNVINAVDTGYITIKDKTADTIVLEPYAVDLKTPFLNLTNYTVINNGKKINSSGNYIEIPLRTGYNSEAYYQYEKITDEAVINKYNELKSNNGDFNELQSLLKTIVPTSNWQKWSYWSGDISNMTGIGYTQSIIQAPDNGLYYMWIYFQGTNADLKDVYGYILVDNFVSDTEKPTVESISVTSPASGTYNTTQTVKIAVNFSEKITGTQVPTLKIKFGDSAVREVKDGTISQNFLNTKGIIEYSYNIQSSDVGQLATVSLTGGNIKDEAGNEAVLSCPIISGNTIKANVEGTTNNQTDNQDKTNNNTTNTKANTNTGTNTNAKDNTTVSGKLPYTGSGIGMWVFVVMLVTIGGITYLKYNKLQGI